MANLSILCREEIADLCVALLEAPSALDATFEIRSKVPFSEPFTVPDSQSLQERDWEALLRAAKLDPKVTGKTETPSSTAKDKSSVPAKDKSSVPVGV